MAQRGAGHDDGTQAHTSTGRSPGGNRARRGVLCFPLPVSAAVGAVCADLCYFYGESGANDLVSRGGLRPAPPAGYDYDGCDSAVVLQRMSVRNGRIVLPGGMSYRVLVLPESRFMTPAMVTKIAELVRAGAVVVGPKPTQSPSLSGYPACDIEVRRIADEVWGDCDGVSVREHRYGLGRVVWGVELADLLKGWACSRTSRRLEPARCLSDPSPH